MKSKRLASLGLSILLLCGCGKSVEKAKVDNQEEAWNMFIKSVETLSTKDEVIIYDVIGTLNTAHDDYSSKEVDGKSVMDYYKAGYNYFLQKTTINKKKDQITYVSDYNSIGECTSQGNKFTYIKYVKNGESLLPKKVTKDYELNYENINNYLNPLYKNMKNGKLNEAHKYVIKSGKATAYVDGRQRYKNKDISSFNYETDTGIAYPPITHSFAKGLLQVILENAVEPGNENYDMMTSNNFDSNWLNVLRPAGRTLWGTELPKREYCKVDINEDSEKTVIEYVLDKESQGFKTYQQEIEKVAKEQDLSWEAVSYFDDAYINIEIDKEGNLKKLEFNTTMAYVNEGIEGFKVPQYAFIEFEYK